MPHTFRLFHPTPSSVRYVAEKLRAADRQEVAAMSGRDPLSVIMEGVEQSDDCFALHEPKTGLPCAIAGVLATNIGHLDVGAIWLLGTDGIAKNYVHFQRGFMPHLDDLNRKWGILANLVDVRNLAHIRWLRHAGFTFGRAVRAGVEQRPFFPFSRVANV